MKPLSKLSHGQTKGSVTGSFYQFQNGKHAAQADNLARATGRASAEARQWLHSPRKGGGRMRTCEVRPDSRKACRTPILGSQFGNCSSRTWLVLCQSNKNLSRSKVRTARQSGAVFVSLAKEGRNVEVVLLVFALQIARHRFDGSISRTGVGACQVRVTGAS